MIAYEHERFLIADKPSGLFVHTSHESRETDNLLKKVRDLKGRWVYPIHRIDRATSGLVIFAFSGDDVEALQSALKAGSKNYIAGVFGSTPAAGVITRPLTDDNGVQRECHTEFTKLAPIKDFGSLLKVQIASGRRHQIRRHLSHLTFHVLGDTQYGKGRINRRMRADFDLHRLFLHAHELDFQNPFEPSQVTVRSPLPSELCRFLEITDEAHEVPWELLR